MAALNLVIRASEPPPPGLIGLNYSDCNSSCIVFLIQFQLIAKFLDLIFFSLS